MTAALSASPSVPLSESSTSQSSCPVCFQTAEVRPLCSVGEYAVLGCAHCGTDFVANPPSEQMLAAMYDQESFFEGGAASAQGAYSDYELQTTGTLPVIEALLDGLGEGAGRSVLDVGCGYGLHLAAAQRRGWSCFGVEPSQHARHKAIDRLGSGASVVASIDDLIPHEFDLILMFDVIEHVSDPYRMFHELYAKGAITPKTRIVITTPNAGSRAARTAPAQWAYRHPPSHLTYYSAQSIVHLLETLQFAWVRVHGQYPEEGCAEGDLAACAGLRVEAGGSTFKAFMHERYVPCTWSRVAEFEHLPRYRLAADRARGKRVLDLGCGTGYGTALLAQAGAQAIGLDIDARAIAWARSVHRASGAEFLCRDDLGESLPAASFDLVTCFEMIEHVDETSQRRVLASIARLLQPEGVLLMSTPNPVVTQRYGENPYHVREMSQPEFQAFLGERFRHVALMAQAIRVDIGFEPLPHAESDRSSSSRPVRTEWLASRADRGLSDAPVAWLAVCSASEAALIEVSQSIQYQSRLDYVGEFIDVQTRLNQERMARHQALDRIRHLERQLQQTQSQLEWAGQSSWQRVQRVSTRLHGTARRVASRAARLLPARFLPLSDSSAGATQALPSAGYAVRMPKAVGANRPRVLHIIPNFMTGGSSRLVVDLIERLGDRYDQSIVTSCVPTPAAYRGPRVIELRQPAVSAQFLEVFQRERPDFLHVHWWGDCDTPWYQAAFDAAALLGIPIIENINTPVAPRVTNEVRHYVYVSDQVRHAWGHGGANETTVYPGSDFSMFRRSPDEAGYGRCVGMVYRLERDKLDDSAIDPIIRVLLARSDAQALIVGGGSLLPVFRDKVTQAGVADRVEFTGYVPYEALPDLYRRMAVFVAPVRKESFGQVSPFAMSMGVPVCGYDIDAVSEVIGDASLLAPAGDADRLAEIIGGLLDSSDTRTEKAAHQCRRARERFSVEAMVEGYEPLYASLVTLELTK